MRDLLDLYGKEVIKKEHLCESCGERILYGRLCRSCIQLRKELIIDG